MRTPKEYTENLKKKVITTSMLEAALLSVNKRAKNWRDSARKAEHSHSKYSFSNYAIALGEKEKYYRQKELLLTVVKPICIHKELLKHDRTRVFEYQKKYNEKMLEGLLRKTIVWSNCYYDYSHDDNVWFFDVIDKEKPIYQYYIYSIVGNHSFHSPIDKSEIEKYNLPLVEISRLQTTGMDISDLLSTQFTSKLIELIKSGDYTFVEDKPSEVNDSAFPTGNDYDEFLFDDETAAIEVWDLLKSEIEKKILETATIVPKILTEKDKNRFSIVPNRIKKSGKKKPGKVNGNLPEVKASNISDALTDVYKTVSSSENPTKENFVNIAVNNQAIRNAVICNEELKQPLLEYKNELETQLRESGYPERPKRNKGQEKKKS